MSQLARITWKRQRQQPQQREQQMPLVRLQRRQVQVRAREQRLELVPEQERVLLSCHKQPEQQQRSQRPIREFCSFVFT